MSEYSAGYSAATRLVDSASMMATLAVLPYATAATPRPSPLTRAGGWCGFLALCAATLFVAAYVMWRAYVTWPAPIPERVDQYTDAVRLVVPPLQAMLCGGGLALVAAGWFQGHGGLRRRGVWIALMLNVSAVAVLGWELSNEWKVAHPQRLVRWTSLTCEM